MYSDRRTFLVGSSVAVVLGAGACEARVSGPTEHINLGLIGHQGHGKTTLAEAIVALQSRGEAVAGYSEPTPDSVISLAVRYSEFRTNKRSYALIDCPGAASSTPAVIDALCGMDGAVLVVAATDGPMPQTREHILLARQMRVEALVVFISKTDLVDDLELLELIEMEMRELLASYQLNGSAVRVVLGSAKSALEGSQRTIAEQGIRSLLEIVDASIPMPLRQLNGTFRMPIQDVFQISGKGLVVTGRIERGRLSVGQTLELVGFRGAQPVRSTGIEMFRATLKNAQAGDNVGVLLEGVDRNFVQRGDVLVTPRSAAATLKFVAESYILTSEEGGLHSRVPVRWPVHLFFEDGLSATAIASPLGGNLPLRPGDVGALEIELSSPLALEAPTRFVIRGEDRTLGMAIVTELFA